VFVSCLVIGVALIQETESPPLNDGPEIRWTHDLKAPSYGSGAAGDIDGDGRLEVVFGTYFNDEHAYALNAEDGIEVWKVKSRGGPIDTSVLVADVNGDKKLEVIFGDSAYGTLYCLDGKGEVVWKYQGQSGTDSPAASADLDGDGTIEVVYGTMKNINGSGNGHVNVLKGKTGELIWTAEVPGHVQSEPALVDLNGDGVLDVMVTNWMGDNRLRALNGKDGTQLWSYETGDWIYHGVCVFDFEDGVKVIVADRKGSVWMLSGSSGEVVWKAKLEGEREGMVFGPMSLVDVERDGVPEIVVCGEHVHLVGVDGTVRWRHKFGGRSIARGAAVGDVDGDGVDDLVFGVGTKLHALRSDTGKALWSIDLKSGEEYYEDIDHAPLLMDIEGDGFIDVFVVSGRGLSGETEGKNYGRAVMLRCRERAESGFEPWLTFPWWGSARGGKIKFACCSTSEVTYVGHIGWKDWILFTQR